MRFITPLFCVAFLFFSTCLSAEGTRELAPNASITIGASTTTDLAALHINHPSFNSFASYVNNDPHSRLYIHVKDPSAECIFLGFSFGHLNVTSPNPTRTNFQYRVKDPAGNIVFGPVTVLQNAANITNWSEGFTGPMQIHGAGGYNAHEVTSADLASQGWTGAGDYYVEFESTSAADFLIDFWDITVADCSAPAPLEKKGRIWSYNWSIFAVNDFGFPNRPFNGAFYVCAPDPDDIHRSFVTKIDFNGSGFRPAAFNVAFNSFGSMNTGNIGEDRKSRRAENSTQSEYAIFLNDPVELCETAVVGEIVLEGISRCDADSYCIKFSTTKEGQIELLLDFDGGDDVYTPGTSDVLITHVVAPEEVGIPSCITWDGLDGLGNPLPENENTQIPITISLAQGIYHFPIFDAELMTTGFNLEAVRPAATIPLLYYDDSNITVPSGSGEPAVQLTGCNVPCHRWSTFVNNDVNGFGNLNTINSWWFSQRIVRQEVLLLPAYYTCAVDGPANICHGSTAEVTLQPVVHPTILQGPEIIGTVWSGPGIVGSNTGLNIHANAAGDYEVIMTWITGTGDTCSSSCVYSLSIDPPLEQTIDTLIVLGNVLDVNGELYTAPGTYIQHLTNAEGCDSTLTIHVKVIQTVLHYDLDACLAFMSDGSHMDYSEFTVDYPQPLSCADIDATILFREPANMQKHSCTPGVNNSVAMCISALDTCDYDAGNDASLVFEVTITPDPDTAIHVTGLSFFEKAPLTYNWISGPSGPNNYPTLYGLRILKNGVEIYRRENISTSNDWSLQSYDFLNEEDFIIEEPALFTFELLPYCFVGNGAEVAAWDIDELSVTASCAPFEGLNQLISGSVNTQNGIAMQNVEVRLQSFFQVALDRQIKTDAAGNYLFTDVPEGSTARLSAYDNSNPKNGVSTLDLIRIQKHLLGHETFTSPYQFIAADANKNHQVTALDILELKKLILGIYTAFPRNTSWRFGNVDENLHGGLPWNFKETLDIEYLEHDRSQMDFTGIKVGDITGDAVVHVDEEITNRNSLSLNLYIEEAAMINNEVVAIPVRIKDMADLQGMQMAFNVSYLNNVSIESGALQINDEDYLLHGSMMTISWHHDQLMHLNAGDILFTIRGTAVNAGYISDFVGLHKAGLQPEAYVGRDLINHEIALRFIGKENESAKNFLFQNTPNPFSESTSVAFYMAAAGKADITITTLSGQMIKHISGYYDKGMHSLDFSAKESGFPHGILYCRLESTDDVSVIKMVNLR